MKRKLKELVTCFACRRSMFDPWYHMVPKHYQEQPLSTELSVLSEFSGLVPKANNAE